MVDALRWESAEVAMAKTRPLWKPLWTAPASKREDVYRFPILGVYNAFWNGSAWDRSSLLVTPELQRR